MRHCLVHPCGLSTTQPTRCADMVSLLLFLWLCDCTDLSGLCRSAAPSREVLLPETLSGKELVMLLLPHATHDH